MSNIQDKPLKKVRELAEPMPRGRLIPITTVLQAISELTNGMASIPELVEVLGRIYDLDKMMMYSGSSYGLAHAIDGNPHDESSGYNERASMVSGLFNSQYWMGKGASYWPGSIGDHADILITRADGVTLAGALWEFFEPGQAFDVDRYNELTEARGKVSLKEEPPDGSGRELKGFAIGIVAGTASSDSQAVKAARSMMARSGAAIRHAENHAMQAEVFDWLDANFTPGTRSMDDVALELAGALVPAKFRTVRDWMTEWKKLRSTGTP